MRGGSAQEEREFAGHVKWGVVHSLGAVPLEHSTFDQYNLQSDAMNLVSFEFQLFTFECIQVPVDATVSRRDRF